MSAIDELFSFSADIDPAAPPDARVQFAAIPAKGAVYLLAARCAAHAPGESTQAGRPSPVLLATVGDLRAALRRRLADTPAESRSKRVAYGQICTRVYWRVVHSSFAANFHYARSARALFPQTAQALIPWQASWWVAVERPGPKATAFPRFRKTSDLADERLAYVGPVRDKHAAQRLVESLEDLFDLCRYHHILLQAPQGKACAYKEMGKCPAPCDGSQTLEAYRRQVDAALGFAGNQTRVQWRQELESLMKAAAARLDFEAAARLKQRLSRAGLLDSDAFSILAPLEDFAFLTLQPGRGKPWIEPWIIDWTNLEPIRQLEEFHIKRLAETAGNLAETCRRIAQGPRPAALSSEHRHQAALVAHHLFKGDADHGIWLRAAEVAARGPESIVQAVQALRARKAPKPLAEQSSDIEEAVSAAQGDA